MTTSPGKIKSTYNSQGIEVHFIFDKPVKYTLAGAYLMFLCIGLSLFFDKSFSKLFSLLFVLICWVILFLIMLFYAFHTRKQYSHLKFDIFAEKLTIKNAYPFIGKCIPSHSIPFHDIEYILPEPFVYHLPGCGDREFNAAHISLIFKNGKRRYLFRRLGEDIKEIIELVENMNSTIGVAVKFEMYND